MSRTARSLALAAGVTALAGMTAAGWLGWALAAPYAGWDGEAVVVELPRGMDAGSMLERLGAAGVLRSPGAARAWIVLRGGSQKLHAGEYRFDRPTSAIDVLSRLTRGDVVLRAVTIPEGLVLDEVARRFAEAGVAGYRELLEVFQDPGPVRDFDPGARDLEGYLFPDTYHFPGGERPRRVAEAMVQRFRTVIGSDYAEAAAAVRLTPGEAVVLASLIEEETSLPHERGRISRVFHNRLARGMRLQCDPTVLYALRRAGQQVASLRQRHLDFDSAWNTYRNHGLPPGPICSPGRESLMAAVNPDSGPELFFVAAPGGGHRFSRDLDAHNRAVRELQRYLRSSR